jgi:hypothetical protein
MGKASNIALNSSKAIERSFTLMGTAIVAATGAAVGALGLLVTKTQDVVFAMQKQAQQAGVSIEQFSKMAYAAKVAGMDQEQMAVIMTRIAKSSFEAASGNKKSAAAYKELGVTVMDANGHFKTADQLAIEVAKSLDGFAESAGKTGVETTIMGRSGAMAASFMNVLANRFDEVSATAVKLGVVFSKDTAEGAQKLHDSLLMVEEAGLGLSVRLLSKVSPALDQLATKIVDFVSNAENMKKIDHIGEELAAGIHLAGEALEFLINHFDTLKTMVEGLVAVRLGGMFIPMIASAAGAEGTIGKLGIALANMAGGLLGIRKMGTIFSPLIANAAGYTTALGGLVAQEGLTATSTTLLATELKTLGAFLGATVLPAALAAGAVYEFGLALKSAHEYADVRQQTGASWFQVMKAEEKEATSSLMDFIGYMRMAIGLASNSEETGFYTRVAQRLGAKDTLRLNPKAPGLPEGYETDPTMGGQKKKDIHPLDMEQDKFAGLTKRLAELKEKAEAATRALHLVGASPQEQRDSKILEEYNLFLAEEKKLLDQLSPAKRAAAEASAHESITMMVNAEAAEKYEKALYDLSITLSTSVQEHESMAAAVGKSAQAMQDAMVKARVAQEMQKAYGNGWEKDPSTALDAEMTASRIRDDMNKANAVDDAKSIDSSRHQVAAQESVNAAILKGADAQRDAAVANEKAALTAEFHTRGDTDTAALKEQLDLIDQRDEAERKSGDLQKAASMDPTLKYQEQKKSIQDAVLAAQEFGHALDYREVLAANKQAWLDYKAAQDKAILSSGSMTDGLRVAFDQMARDTESAAQQMHDAVMQAVGSLNEAIEKAMMVTGRDKGRQIKQDFGNAFKSIGGNLAKKSLDKAEQSVLQTMGFGSKNDGSSQGRALWVQDVNGAVKKAAGGLLGTGTNYQGSPQTNELDSLVGGVLGGSGADKESGAASNPLEDLISGIGKGSLDDTGKGGSKLSSVFGALRGLFGMKAPAAKDQQADYQGTPDANELSSLLSGVAKSSSASSSMTSTTTPQSGVGNDVSSLVGSFLHFLPMFADGTDSMVPDMPAIVGEKGPELFVPPSAGAIVPNSRLKKGLGGGDTHINVDARGATDPAQTAFIVQQAIKEAAPHIMNATLNSARETGARSPRAARG